MKKKILIVDDEKSTRSLLKYILLSDDFDLIEAEDGKEALELLKKQKIDLMITDRSMPQMGGLELLKELRRLKSKLPVIVISAYGEESLWGEAIGLGALDYIVKPFAADVVLNVVRKNLFGGKPS